MIDRIARSTAGALISQFLSGDIDSDVLESEWPNSKGDAAIEAIASAIWLMYDDFKPRRMVGNDGALPEEELLLNRYAAFLESDFPYDWPQKTFYLARIPRMGALVRLSFGLLRPVDDWIASRNSQANEAMDRHGSWEIWPFRSEREWSGPACPPFIRE